MPWYLPDRVSPSVSMSLSNSWQTGLFMSFADRCGQVITLDRCLWCVCRCLVWASCSRACNSHVNWYRRPAARWPSCSLSVSGAHSITFLNIDITSDMSTFTLPLIASVICRVTLLPVSVCDWFSSAWVDFGGVLTRETVSAFANFAFTEIMSLRCGNCRKNRFLLDSRYFPLAIHTLLRQQKRFHYIQNDLMAILAIGIFWTRFLWKTPCIRLYLPGIIWLGRTKVAWFYASALSNIKAVAVVVVIR